MGRMSCTLSSLSRRRGCTPRPTRRNPWTSTVRGVTGWATSKPRLHSLPVSQLWAFHGLVFCAPFSKRSRCRLPVSYLFIFIFFANYLRRYYFIFSTSVSVCPVRLNLFLFSQGVIFCSQFFVKRIERNNNQSFFHLSVFFSIIILAILISRIFLEARKVIILM